MLGTWEEGEFAETECTAMGVQAGYMVVFEVLTTLAEEAQFMQVPEYIVAQDRTFRSASERLADVNSGELFGESLNLRIYEHDCDVYQGDGRGLRTRLIVSLFSRAESPLNILKRNQGRYPTSSIPNENREIMTRREIEVNMEIKNKRGD